MGADEKGGALLPIAAPSMSCEENRPLASHSEGNSNRTRVISDPAFTMPACLLTVTVRCMRRWLSEICGGCAIRTHSRNFSSVFCQRTVVLSHTPREMSMEKITPTVCGLSGRSAVAELTEEELVEAGSLRSQRNQLESAAALASEDVSVGSMVAVILLWRRVSTTPK